MTVGQEDPGRLAGSFHHHHYDNVPVAEPHNSDEQQPLHFERPTAKPESKQDLAFWVLFSSLTGLMLWRIRI